MHISQYTKEIALDAESYLLYNTLSRKYLLYPTDKRKWLHGLLEHLNAGSYSLQEVEMIKELLEKGLVIDNGTDEALKLEYLENKAKYGGSYYHLTIFATNACNFRCTYCTQEHEPRNMDADVIKNIISLIQALSANVRYLYITWFGGEPFLQYETIRKIMRQAVSACEQNNCCLETDFVTNGYLLSRDKIAELKCLGTSSLQITVDSCQNIHDARRVLKNGQGSYRKVVSHLCMAAEAGLNVVLRINIDKETFRYPFQILDDIPQPYRKFISVSVSNIFQETEKQSSFSILLSAIQKGYQYGGRKNNYAGCATCGNKTINIDTNGNLLFCTNCGADGVIGTLRENGKIRYMNRTQYQQKLMVTARENEACQKCVQLPFCIGGCPLARQNQNSQCLGVPNDGLTLEERAKLDYYYDCQQIERKRKEETA